MVKILFMCVANSARSQMAEGLAKHVFGDKAEIQSAGSQPTRVNPLAIEALRELGIDITSHHSKTYERLPPAFTRDFNYLITLCAEEVCPVVITKTAKKLHWPFPDPAGHAASHEEQLRRFREARDGILKKLEAFKVSLGL
ncbi:MAG TPA: arsenate reductase ArsC [Bdellovibrionales bacterium]|nr:arsenate reductase ArsC [Bdellovibrionales bacterium]